jgi:hypothetical protein
LCHFFIIAPLLNTASALFSSTTKAARRKARNLSFWKNYIIIQPSFEIRGKTLHIILRFKKRRGKINQKFIREFAIYRQPIPK